MTTNIARLVAFLNSHSVTNGPTFRGVGSDGRLLVACWVTSNNGTEGREVIESIAPNMRACREWLGY